MIKGILYYLYELRNKFSIDKIHNPYANIEIDYENLKVDKTRHLIKK